MLSLKEMMKVRSAQKVQSKFDTLIWMISLQSDDGTVKQKQQNQFFFVYNFVHTFLLLGKFAHKIYAQI